MSEASETTQFLERNAEDLKAIFEKWRDCGAIVHSRRHIEVAGLNVTDRPSLKKDVPITARYLYGLLVASRIEYDAVVGIPRGGTCWAEAIVDCAAREGKCIPFAHLNKNSKGGFSVPKDWNMKGDAKLLLVDDTLFRGWTAASAIRELKSKGFTVAGFATPAEIGLEGRDLLEEYQCPVISLFNDFFIQSVVNRGQPRSAFEVVLSNVSRRL